MTSKKELTIEGPCNSGPGYTVIDSHVLLEGTALRKSLAFQVRKKIHIDKKLTISTRNTVSCFVSPVLAVLGLYAFYKKQFSKCSCPRLYPYRRPNLLPGFLIASE